MPGTPQSFSTPTSLKDTDTQANNNLSWEEKWKNYITNSKYYKKKKKEKFF
jgi:hypothetical protein